MGLYDFAEKIYALEQTGTKVAKLFIGESEMDTPREIVEAACDAMIEGKTRYTSAAGEKALREKIAEVHGVGVEQVVVMPGSKFSVYAALQLLVGKGGSVAGIAPYWPGFRKIAESQGIKFDALKTRLEDKWSIDASQVSKMMKKTKAKMLILNSPTNPTCRCIPRKEFGGLLDVAEENDAFVVSDDAYRGLAFAPQETNLDFSNPRHILVNSFSKTFSMTGWREGYIVASREIVESVIRLNQATFSCVPPFEQFAALKTFELNKEIERRRKVYESRAKLAASILSKEFELLPPESGFYVFAGRKGLDSEKFALELLDEGVAVAPGSDFGAYGEFIRISLVQEEGQLRKSLEKINEVAAKNG